MKRFVDSLQGEKMLPGYASLRLVASSVTLTSFVTTTARIRTSHSFFELILGPRTYSKYKFDLQQSGDHPMLTPYSLIASIPNFVRPPLAWVLRNVVGDERKASILG